MTFPDLHNISQFAKLSCCGVPLCESHPNPSARSDGPGIELPLWDAGWSGQDCPWHQASPCWSLDSVPQEPRVVTSLPRPPHFLLSHSLQCQSPGEAGLLPEQKRLSRPGARWHGHNCVLQPRAARGHGQNASPGQEMATQAFRHWEICCWKRMKYL